MNRAGCKSCGDVIMSRGDDFVLCSCGSIGILADRGKTYGQAEPPVDLPAAPDVLAFKLRHAGRHDEAVDVEDRHAVLQEHTPC